MNRVLVVSPNGNALGGLSTLLRSAECKVYEVSGALEAVRVAREVRPEGALIVDVVPDTSSRELMETLRGCVPSIVCVVVDAHGRGIEATGARTPAAERTQFVAVRDALYAVRLLTSMGARVVETELHVAEAHSLQRWAEPVVRVIGTPSDPRTLAEWGRCIGVSLGALRNWCRTAHLSSHRSLLFARVLRAVVRQQTSGSRAEDLLNIVDRRTLAKLLLASGGQPTQLPPTLDDFLNRQRLIENADAVAQVRKMLESIGLAASAGESAGDLAPEPAGSWFGNALRGRDRAGASSPCDGKKRTA